MILKGAILIPNIPDSAGDVLDEEAVRKASLIANRLQILIDVQHSLQPVGKLLESYITDNEVTFLGNTYPKGTWFKSVDVTDPEVEQAVKDGKYKGFSMLAAPYKSTDEMDRGIR